MLFRRPWYNLRRLIPSARIELFDHETHMLPIERGAEVARVLSKFLALG